MKTDTSCESALRIFVARDFRNWTGLPATCTLEQVAALLSKTREAAMTGKHEGFKTRTDFDATARHPEWIS